MKEIVLNTVKKSSPNYRKYSALVDDEDYERVSQYKWCTHKDGNTFYAVARINGKYTKMHIFIMGFKGVDHMNGRGLDNQKHNLRKATEQQNGMNRKSNDNATSNFKGVCWNKKNGKWTAQIKHNRKQSHLGYFVSEIEAARAYNFKAKELFGEFANLNNI